MTPRNITALSWYLTMEEAVEARLLIQLDPFNARAQVLISDICMIPRTPDHITFHDIMSYLNISGQFSTGHPSQRPINACALPPYNCLSQSQHISHLIR